MREEGVPAEGSHVQRLGAESKLVWEHFSKALASDEAGDKSGEVWQLQMPAWIRGLGSRGRVLCKEGAWSDLWLRRVSAAGEVSEWERNQRQGDQREAEPCLPEGL